MRPNQNRHTYASTMLAVGEDLTYIAKQMGHADSSTTLKYYARFNQQTGVKNGSKLEEEYKKQIGSKVHNHVPFASFLPDS